MKYIKDLYSFLNETEVKVTEDSVWTKKTLNPAIWDKDENLNPAIAAKLKQIANEFYEATEFKAPIIDMQLTGSNANYNYTKYSDLDVHIIIDFKAENEDIALVGKAANDERWIWNTQHKIMIKGYEVEMYIQDVAETHTNNGLYSLTNDSWIEKPTYQEPDTDPVAVQKKAQPFLEELSRWKDALEHAESRIEAKAVYDGLKDLRTKVTQMRRGALSQDVNSIFSIENLAFKELRNNGTLEDIFNLATAAYDKMYELD